MGATGRRAVHQSGSGRHRIACHCPPGGRRSLRPSDSRTCASSALASTWALVMIRPSAATMKPEARSRIWGACMEGAAVGNGRGQAVSELAVGQELGIAVGVLLARVAPGAQGVDAPTTAALRLATRAAKALPSDGDAATFPCVLRRGGQGATRSQTSRVALARKPTAAAAA